MIKDTLEIDSVIKSYNNSELLNNIYLKCETGNVVGILGRNGCGKSTLLKILFGTVFTFNKNIRINGKNYNKPYTKGDLITYMPQDGFLPNRLSVKRIISLFITDKSKRENILSDVHIKEHLNKRVGVLSAGELRYFEVILLLNLNTKFVVLDEPFSKIEPITKEKIKDLLLEYKSHKGIIITDHDYRNIIDSSDQLYIITHGTCKLIKDKIELENMNYIPEGTFTN